MIRSGILNPGINRLISRFRHTNLLVIADRGFPFWPEIETIDISLVDDLPRVLDVFHAIEQRCVVGRVPGAVGLIRTGDTTPYANMILESA